MQDEILTVSEFIGLINQTLEFAYPRVTIEGEVSGFQIRQNKWVRFDLKDKDSLVHCFMTKWQLHTALEDGMQVRITARPRLKKWGELSLTVERVNPIGEGALRRAYELLKAKLDQEGLFAPERKRTLLRFPARIGLVASTESAAYKDFLEILDKRWGGVTVYTAHVQVQGEPAPDQIVRAVDYFNQLSEPVDVLVITRGGGSLEDLNAFNAEPVARAVAGSRTPVIVGVGHEIDTTLADLAADVRAATPTDAARLVVSDKTEVQAELAAYARSVTNHMERRLERADYTISRVSHVLGRYLQVPQERVRVLQAALTSHIQATLRENKGSLVALFRTLRSMDPEAILRRGYAIVRRNNKVITSARDVKARDEIVIKLAHARLLSEVRDVETD